MGAAGADPTSTTRKRNTRRFIWEASRTMPLTLISLKITNGAGQKGVMAHHIFIHFILTVNHFLLSTDQSSVLLSHSRSCVGERSQQSVSQAGLASCQHHSSSRPPPEGGGALAITSPPPCPPRLHDMLLHSQLWGCTVLCKDERYRHFSEDRWI